MKTTARKAERKDESLDSFYKGRILVLQKKRGYRFALDAPLLADFIRTKPGDEILELGAGNGIISLLLSLRPFRRITAVEIQPSLAGLARRNVRLNGFEDKVTVVRKDFRKYAPRKKFDIVYSNPPYIPRQTGFLSSSREKSIAKHEIKCDILDVMRKTAELLQADGKAYFVYPAKRRADLMDAAGKYRLHLCALRFVHARRREAPNLLLAEFRFGTGSVRSLRPLVLYDAGGGPTKEARRVFEGRIRGPAG